jgi:TetR/AcrR family transcriptional regulator of autoinduction and epiphytic fitness
MEGGPIANEPIDGRHARRQRSREAIVSAAFELILEGKGPPSAEDVAERAGVSVSSIFRNFEGLADIQQQAHQLFAERYSHLLLATPPPQSDLDTRIAFFVHTRLDLYEQAGPLMAMARMRAFEDDTWREHIASNRSALARQLRACFDPEIAELTPSDSADLVSVMDSITSPEAFELMTRAHARTRKQINRAWTTTLHTLITHDRNWGLTPIASGERRGTR